MIGMQLHVKQDNEKPRKRKGLDQTWRSNIRRARIKGARDSRFK